MLKATVSDIEYCYRLFLGRQSDPAGFRVFENLVEAGLSPLDLAHYFIASAEGQRIVASRESGQSSYTVKQLLHGVMAIVPGWNSINAEISETGEYERNVAEVLGGCIRQGMTFVDLGANVGYFSVFAAARGARVIAVEPHPRNVFLLAKSNALNGFDIEIFPGIVAATSAFYLYNFLDGNGEIEEIGDALPTAGQSICRATTLDTLMNGRRADVIKMDVQGAEGLVLAAADSTFSAKPVLVCEFAPHAIRAVSRIDPADFIRKIQSFGYKFELIDREGVAPVALSAEALLAAGEASAKGFVDFIARPE
jgi:FkbM family methyltransferase